MKGNTGIDRALVPNFPHVGIGGSSRAQRHTLTWIPVLACAAIVLLLVQNFAHADRARSGAPLTGVAGLEQQCDENSTAACNDLGADYAANSDTGESAAGERAAHLFRKTCRVGDGVGCNNLGTLYVRGAGVTRDAKRAVALFELGCNAGNAEACSNWGAMYEQGRGTRQDLEEAQRLYEKACDGGAALGCSNLGALYASGKTGEVDPRLAEQLFQQACNGGNPLGCYNLQQIHESFPE